MFTFDDLISHIIKRAHANADQAIAKAESGAGLESATGMFLATPKFSETDREGVRKCHRDKALRHLTDRLIASAFKV